MDDLVAFAGTADWPARPIVTAGGSAYFDLVAEGLAVLTGTATLVLRSGAFQIHDAHHYSELSPLRDTLRSAMHGWSRVVSTPEPGVALLDGGKRDFPYDLDLPTSALGPITKVNDQHAFVATGQASTARAAVGDVVRLGLSHPCTAFDKWRAIPVVADADADDPVVVDVVRTVF